MKSHTAEQGERLPELVAAAEQALPQQVHALQRARAFAEPLIAGETLETGENTLAHADAVAAILKAMGGSEAMQAASYLVYACPHLNKPQEVIAKAFGESYAALAIETTKLVRVQQQARGAEHFLEDKRVQTENVRKMLLAFSRDLRVVMLRLASRLQTLRHYAATKQPMPPAVAREALQVFAPLANRLGIWQVKWEMEDLAFRFLEPDTYKQVAR
ncbi:MAG TPA: HD domain-containing protein, partial [Ramlibacter sp.]|uniref:HD domain-containing protein n=1 Tax=Ramlibacter sp. TaxID=1917967 RepID=UPI002D7E48C1